MADHCWKCSSQFYLCHRIKPVGIPTANYITPNAELLCAP